MQRQATLLTQMLVTPFTYPPHPTSADIGVHFLNAVLRKVALVHLHDESLYDRFHHDFPTLCVTYLLAPLSQKAVRKMADKLLVCFGEMFTRGSFQHERQIEAEVAEVLRHEQAKFGSIEEISEIRPMDEEVTQIVYFNEGDMPCSEKGYLEREETSKRHQELEKKVEEYLREVPRNRTELAEFCQLMGLPHPFCQSKLRPSKENETRVFLEVSTGQKGMSRRFSGLGVDFNQRESVEKASGQLLLQLYLAMPELWVEFVELKRKKGMLAPSWKL